MRYQLSQGNQRLPLPVDPRGRKMYLELQRNRRLHQHHRNEPRQSRQSHVPDIARGNEMKENVERALSFQRLNPNAMRGSFRSEPSSAAAAGLTSGPTSGPEPTQLAGTTCNVDATQGNIGGAASPMDSFESNKGMAEGKRPAAVAGLEDTVAKKITSDVAFTPSASNRSDERARILAALELANEATMF